MQCLLSMQAEKTYKDIFFYLRSLATPPFAKRINKNGIIWVRIKPTIDIEHFFFFRPLPFLTMSFKEICHKCGKKREDSELGSNSGAATCDIDSVVSKCQKWLQEKCSISEGDSIYSHGSHGEYSITTETSDVSENLVTCSAKEIIFPAGQQYVSK